MRSKDEDLENLYRLLAREQSSGYNDSSSVTSFEDFVADWCNKINNPQAQSILDAIRAMSEGYETANRDIRERKITETGRMLLSLRDTLHDSARTDRYEYKKKTLDYERDGDLDDAVAELERSLESKANDISVLSRLSQIYLKQNKIEESSRLIEKALKIDASDAYANGVKGELLFIEGNLEGAAEIFEGLLNLKPNDVYPYSKLGMIYRKQGRVNESLSVLRRGLEIDPADPSLHHALGDVYGYLEKDEESVTEYQKALDIDPEDNYAFRGLVSRKTKGRDINSIISQIQKILKIPSRAQNPHLHALLAVYLKKAGKYKDAVDALRESVRLQPNSSYFKTQLAFCYSKLGEYQKVIEILEPINRIKPRDPIITQALAKAYQNTGRIGEARSLLIDILYIYPNDHSLRSALMKLTRPRKRGITVEAEDGK